MDHNSYKELLSALLDGELNETERAAALAHLAECEECRAYFAELTAMHDALNDLDEAEPPADFAAGVLARLHEEAVPQKTKKRGGPWRSWAALAACAAVAALAILLPGKGMGKTATSSSEYASAAPTASAPTETTSDYSIDYPEPADAGPEAPASPAEEIAPNAYINSNLMMKDALETSPSLSFQQYNRYSGFSMSTENAYYDSSSAAFSDSSMDLATSDASGYGKTIPSDSFLLPVFPPYTIVLSDPAVSEYSEREAADPTQTLTLVGEGAAEWLAEHAEPLGDGRWLVSVEAVNELPDTLELVGLQEPQDGMLVILFETPENP